jgi:endonuclease YncB( thermonuclease family)
MQLRESLLNLAITCVLVLIVVLVAILLKQGQPVSVPAAVPVNIASANAQPNVRRPVLDQFVSLPAPEFIDSRANEADIMRIKSGAEEFVFVLYFIDAAEVSTTNSSRLAEQARYFNNTSAQAVIDTGKDAIVYVRELLTKHPFTVLTRWEQIPNSTRYYALIVVEYAPGKRSYLADLLVRKGLARVAGITTFLPTDDPRTMEDYLFELKNLGRQAKLKKEGVWGK